MICSVKNVKISEFDLYSRRARDSCAHELLSCALGANDVLTVGDEALARHRNATRTAEETLQDGKASTYDLSVQMVSRPPPSSV